MESRSILLIFNNLYKLINSNLHCNIHIDFYHLKLENKVIILGYFIVYAVTITILKVKFELVYRALLTYKKNRDIALLSFGCLLVEILNRQKNISIKRTCR